MTPRISSWRGGVVLVASRRAPYAAMWLPQPTPPTDPARRPLN
ncbi:MAG TPA: hypothetical protein VJN88_10700 [Ktedonobacterales bacterium]|nr:hypothetical protein [Ktedonobacterales bacterium]